MITMEKPLNRTIGDNIKYYMKKTKAYANKFVKSFWSIPTLYFTNHKWGSKSKLQSS